MFTIDGDSGHNLQGSARRSGGWDCSIYGGLKVTNHFEMIHNSRGADAPTYIYSGLRSIVAFCQIN
jgi:hypothetical protein